jgi:hypothetical protein
MQLPFKKSYKNFLLLIVLLFCFTTWTIAQIFSQPTYAQPQIPTVISVTPLPNTINITQDSVITATFSTGILSSTLNDSTIKINGSLSGLHSNTFDYDSATCKATITPKTSFEIGELVTVTFTRGIISATEDSLFRSYSWSFTVKTNASSGLYRLSSSIQMGDNSSPHSVTALDIDRNGILDLAVANYGLGTVTILKNDSTGSFVQDSTMIVGNNPNTVISADINSDGFSDLILTNNGSGTISVLKNDRTGKFTSTTVTVGSHPVSITAADFNGDGAIDLAVVNNYSWTVSILKNNGNGTFTLASTISVGQYPSSVAAADLNNDGFIDLAVTNAGAYSVSILLNDGSGAFTLNTSLSVGDNPWNVIASDFNGDGYLDLAVTNNQSGTVSLLKNNGTGNFTLISTLYLGGNTSSVKAVDVNGDGSLDLAIGNNTLNTLSFWINNGAGSFTAGSIVNVDSYPCSATAADFDGNGKIELITANGIGNTVSIIIARRNSATIVTYPTTISFGSVLTGNSKSKYLKIFNDGIDSSLVISNISSSNAAFIVDRTSVTIPASGCDSILVTFLPTIKDMTFSDSLIIECNDPEKPYAKVTLTGSTINHPPIANAGPDQNIYADSLSGALVSLDASLSYDEDGDTLIYTWKKADTLLAIGMNPSVFLSIGIDTITLTVGDGKGGLDTDQVIISIFYSPNGLVAYYPFNGNVNDSTGNGNDGISYGVKYTANRYGEANKAGEFDGGAYVRIPELLSDSCSELTFTAWIKKYVSDNNDHHIINKGTYNGATGMSITNGEIGFGVLLTSHTWYSPKIPDTLRTNVDYFVVGRYVKGQKAEFFLNGRLVSSLSVPNLNLLRDTTGTFSTIGAYGYLSVSKFWDGVIDDIRIYAKALTQEEVDSLYHEGGWMPTNVNETQNTIPISFSLSQNYPNPFNPSTKIEYQVPKASFVSIKVYNILGQQIYTLRDIYQQAGYYEVIFENASLPSGIYFYQMRAGSFVDTKKMLLVK